MVAKTKTETPWPPKVAAPKTPKPEIVARANPISRLGAYAHPPKASPPGLSRGTRKGKKS